MVLKQGEEYNDSTEVTEVVPEGAEQEEDEGGKKSLGKKPLIAIIIAVAVLVLGIVTYYGVVSKGSDEEEPIGEDIGVVEMEDTDSDIVDEDDSYWDDFEDLFLYTEAEKQELRAWGYTGDEIEQNQTDQVPADILIEESKKAQEEARKTLSNPESWEYQELLNKTWIGQDSLWLPAYDPETTDDALLYSHYTTNADYEKIPAHGHNLFLKVWLDDGSYVFMECPLDRYMQLKDKGNIVVSYLTTTLDGITIISDMEETVIE